MTSLVCPGDLLRVYKEGYFVWQSHWQKQSTMSERVLELHVGDLVTAICFDRVVSEVMVMCRGHLGYDNLAALRKEAP